MKKFTIKRMAFVAVFAALSSILYCYVKFPLPIFPPFLDVNFSMIPIIICAFMFGPIDASIVVLLRFVVKLILVGTGTQYVGEIADLVLGLIPTITAGCIYQFYKGNKKELIAFISVIVTWVATSIFLNIFVNIPFYLELFFKGSWDGLIGYCGDCFKLISFGAVKEVTKENFMTYYILLGIIPFNLMLSGIVVLVTVLVHKRLKSLYDLIGQNN